MSAFSRRRANGEVQEGEGLALFGIPGLGENKYRPQSGSTPRSYSRSGSAYGERSGSAFGDRSGSIFGERSGSAFGGRSGESSRSCSPSPRPQKRPQTAPVQRSDQRGHKPVRTSSRGGAFDSSEMSGIMWQPLSPVEVNEEPFVSEEARKGVEATPFFASDSGKILIKGGQVVNSDEMIDGDVLIVDGVITAVGVDIEIPEGAQVIDASNKYVIPGGIDTNTHLHEGMDNLEVVDDFACGTKAGLAGGTTMVIDLVIPRRDESLIDAFNAWKEDAEQNSCCDFALSVAVPQWNEKIKGEMEELTKQEGINSYKMFMAYKDELMLDDNDLLETFHHVKNIGGVAKVHAENGAIIAENQKRLLAQGVTGPEGFPAAQPEEIEEEAVLRACSLAKQANAPVIISAPSSTGAAEVIKQAREKGQVVLGEPTPAALALDGSHYFNNCWDHAASFITSPPLREDPNTPGNLMTELVEDGLQMVGSDNCTYSMDIKKRGRYNFTKIPQGVNGIEDRMAIVYQKGVHEGKMKMTRFVEVTSTAAAKVFNIYPKKGCIAEGSDADIVVWNPNNIRAISQKTQHQASEFNVFEGMTVRGAPEFVLSKGKIVVAEYQVNASPGSGEFVETPAFPSHLYDKIQDLDRQKRIVRVERSDIPVDDVDGSSSPQPTQSFGMTTPRGYCVEKVYNKSLGSFQRPLSANGVRNQQDSTFSLSGGNNSPQKTGKRSSVKVAAPPGGGNTCGNFFY